MLRAARERIANHRLDFDIFNRQVLSRQTRQQLGHAPGHIVARHRNFEDSSFDFQSFAQICGDLAHFRRDFLAKREANALQTRETRDQVIERPIENRLPARPR